MKSTDLLNSKYTPSDFESNIYKDWIKKGYFRPEIDKDKPAFTIVIPPPNVTGQLHMGHALDNTIQDIIIRWKRMSGYSTLWLPGTDHASIATEAKIVEKLRQEGKSKYDIGRDQFLELAWEWKEHFGGRIIDQLKKLGCSCDWSRERFTFDEEFSQSVIEAFISLYNKGLIYKGERIINWCPKCKTSISDEEVIFSENNGSIWRIKYCIPKSTDYIIVATTRPETILGDTAIAVNPEDERYKHLIGKTVIVPFSGREIPIITDGYVDMKFGTGAVKITPAHDPNDFEVGLRHNLSQIKIMNDDATMNENAGKYNGMDRYEARKVIIEDLKQIGCLVKVEDHSNNVGVCYRCNSIVEPMISNQWFVRMKELAEPAIDVVRKSEVEFIPGRFTKVYYNWMENIRDWCISRQLWWGHRIPAYYCSDCNNIVIAPQKPEKCDKCGGVNFTQDEDTLDTWFSAALWPFATLGWPKKTEDFDYYFPTSMLVTGHDIIFFWVARMIFSSLEHVNTIPFKHIYMHGIVRDAQGRKMSKSLGNGIDPLEIIEKYGADSLRFSLLIGNSAGNDIKYSNERVESIYYFANKIWNASKFVLMNLDLRDQLKNYNINNLTLADKWILNRTNKFINEITSNLEKFEFGIASQKLYEFFRDEFCDWYIELVKLRLYNKENPTRLEAQYVLNKVLCTLLKLLHPYMPFLTSKVYENLEHDGVDLIISSWPQVEEDIKFDKEEEIMTRIIELIRNIRNIRSEMNIPNSKITKVYIPEANEAFSLVLVEKDCIEKLSKSEITLNIAKDDIPENSYSFISMGIEIFICLNEAIDINKELERLEKEKENYINELERVDGLLSNEKFLSKAPKKKIDEEVDKKHKYQELLNKTNERIDEIKSI